MHKNFFRQIDAASADQELCLYPFSNARNESIFSQFRREELCSLDSNHLFSLTTARINHLSLWLMSNQLDEMIEMACTRKNRDVIRKRFQDKNQAVRALRFENGILN